METHETFRFYGNYDVSNFQKILNENNFDWYEWDFRAKKFGFKIHCPKCFDSVYLNSVMITGHVS